MPENRDEEKNHYWSLRDIPKFGGKGEQPFSHLMEFKDYLIASGVRIEPEEDNAGRRFEITKISSTNSKHHLRTMLEFGIVCTLMVESQICTQRQNGKQSGVGFFLISIQ